jgi:hypothetical protein
MPENATPATGEFGLVPFFGDPNKYYVYIGETMVAGIGYNLSSNRWFALTGPSEVEYDLPLLAAFADATLTDPEDWA